MANGDNTSTGVGMGMIIGLLLVAIILIGGGLYVFGGRGASNPAAAVASAGDHTISGSATVK